MVKCISDIGRIYIKGYLYPIIYPIQKSRKRILFWAGYVEESVFFPSNLLYVPFNI
jgi:hypothetical protein